MPGEENPQQPVSVLYVDDEVGLLELGKDFLGRTSGFKVDIMDDPQEALERLLTDRYDAIVSDYQMPSMDGIAFLKELRKRNNRTPLIIFTGKGREDVVIEALNSGADFYLQKGGNPSAQFAELSNMIRQSVCKKKNEIQLYRTKQNLAAILDTMIDGMVITDVNGTILSMNKTTLKTMDMENECGLLGTNVFDHILDEDQGWLKEEFVKTLYGKQTPMRPFRSVTPDGKVMWMEAISTKMRYEGQDAVLIVFRDISQRMAAEERLRLSEERYSSIVESQTEMICRFLPNLDVTFMNRSFINTFKQAIDGEVRNIGEFASPSEREMFKQFLRNFTPEDRMKTLTRPFPLKDGTDGSVEWNVHVLFDAEGVPVGYQAVGRIKVVVKRAVNRN
ncbi:MAG: hypothetical protein PWQ62_1238 [Candidatus Methanomethylophilaceae archaeon]|nr:hypothetical protein [Candidatus Methanomethylophilaceae archaeon]